jgi:hypothetical protein
MHLLNQFFGPDTDSTGAYHNRSAVSVIGAEVKALVAAHFLEANPYIGLKIFHQMAYMNRTICIGQS